MKVTSSKSQACRSKSCIALVIRRGLLARAPLIGRYLRAYRRAALKYQIDVAEKRLARLEGMDNKQRNKPASSP